jgi:hypothetical protein
MSDAFLTALVPVIVALVTVVGQRLSGRNDRAQTHQEVDLLAKLDARSRAASNLNQVIEDRIEDWHRRAHRRTRESSRAVRGVWYCAGLSYLFIVVSLAVSQSAEGRDMTSIEALVVWTAIGVAGAALLLAIVLLALAVYYYFVVERAQRSTILGSRERDS